MKKSRKFLFVVPLGILLGTSLFAIKPNFNVQKALAEEPVSTEVSEKPTSEEITSISDSEEVVINVDEEVGKISQQAKDFIECVKTVLNQPIVIGGVSVSVGAIVLWVIGKIFGNYLATRNKKYDKKIAELLKQIGIDEETIKYLLEQLETLKPVIEEIINSTKNIQVKEKLEKLYYESKDKVVETHAEIVEDAKEVAAEVVNEVNNNTEEIRKLFKK